MRLINLEGDTNFTCQNQSAVEGQNLRLCLLSLILLFPRRVSPFLQWGDFHARSSFARSTIPEENWGTTRSLAIRLGDTGQRRHCFDSCQLIETSICNQISPGLPNQLESVSKHRFPCDSAVGVQSRDYQIFWDGQIYLPMVLRWRAGAPLK